MRYSGWNPLKLQSVSTPVRYLAGIVAIFLAGWFYLANLGCFGTWEDLSTFHIKFTPAYFLIEQPGQSTSVFTELLWSSAGRNQEATSWSVLPGLPPVLESASCNPDSESDYTNLALQFSSDASLFGASDLWTASVSSAFQVGVKARFVDPLWKSLSEGQEVVIARTAYFPLRSGASRFIVRQDGFNSRGNAIVSIEVENPLDGWTYFCEGEEKSISKEGTSFWGRIESHQLDPTGPNIQSTPFDKWTAAKACVRLVLTMKKNGAVVKTEVRNIPMRFES